MEHIRFDADQLRPDQREELIAWVRTLEVEPDDVRPQGAIVTAERNYELHLSRFVRDAAGKMRVDWAANEVVTEPLIVDLGSTPTWPTWLESASTCRQCGFPLQDCARTSGGPR